MLEVPKVVAEKPPILIKAEGADCLLISCSELAPIFKNDLHFICDESYLEESAVKAVIKSIERFEKGECSMYKFIFIDLDDPTTVISRFMAVINKLLKENPKIKMETFACGGSGGDRMVKKCEEHRVKFIAKPIT